MQMAHSFIDWHLTCKLVGTAINLEWILQRVLGYGLTINSTKSAVATVSTAGSYKQW